MSLASLVSLLSLLMVGCNAEEDFTFAQLEPQGSIEDVAHRPNILLIVADDIGYTDLGSYGSEIATPNLDSLAQKGTQFSQFYTAAACSPTRAMLLTGVDHHLVGLGALETATLAENQEGLPGYEGYLNLRAANLGEIFTAAGYNTYVTGKWHLGEDANHSPATRGFRRSFVQIAGGAGHFNALPATPMSREARFRENGSLAKLPESFYSSDFYADKMIEYIETDYRTGRPFVGYLAMTAPHWPLQAKAETIAKYEKAYLSGYEALAEKRRQGLIDQEIVSYDLDPAPYQGDLSAPWDSLSVEERQYEAKRMAVYAAMIDDMDNAIGRVIDYLRKIDEFDNTVIIFMSDNGAEGHDLEFLRKLVQLFTLFGISCCDNSYENLGNANSFIGLGPKWAQASVGPHRIYKGFPTEGGIRSPAFVSSPLYEGLGVHHGFLTVKDVLPSLLEVAGIDVPKGNFLGRQVLPMEGRSIVPLLEGKSTVVHDDDTVMGWELFSKHAVRSGDWKLLRLPEPYGDNEWELYNLATDPTESNNQALSNPAMLQKMIALWEDYQLRSNVILPIDLPFEY